MMGTEIPSPIVTTKSGIDSDARNEQSKREHMHGYDYQLKLLMLILHRGVEPQYSFNLRTKVEEAEKFDGDFIIEYLDPDKRKQYFLFQAKHGNNESNKISAVDLMTDNDGEYSLIKYFFYYKYSKREKIFKNGAIKNIIIFTNLNFDFESLRNAQIECEEVDDLNDILTHKGVQEQATQYKINENFGSKLKPILQNHYLTKLAKRLVTSILKSCLIDHHQEDIFRIYHVALAEEVIDIGNRKFYDSFIRNKDISDDAVKFRYAFQKEIQEQSNGKLTLQNINEAIIDKILINDEKVGLNLSKKFGNGNYKGWSVDSITDNEIKKYLNCLLFAMNQPNEQKLSYIIKMEISEEFGLDSVVTEHVYNKFLVKMMAWMRRKRTDTYLSYEDGRKFLESAQKGVPIRFNVKEPIKSFTGRINELQKLHAALQESETTIPHTVAIGGLGGIGKSELVRKYVNEYGRNYEDNIIWLNAESHKSLEESFRRLARDKLGINIMNADGDEKKSISIVEDVYGFFSKRESLFIFDDAVQRRSTKEGDGGISRFWPFRPAHSRNKPHILITSRNQKWGDLETLVLDTFTEEEAVEFIKKNLPIDNNEQKNDVIELARKLQYFPLALHQAVAYINAQDAKLKNVNSKFKISDYLQSYEEKTKELLNFPFSENCYNFGTKTTFMTWESTIESIRQKQNGEEAIKILDTLAYLISTGNPSRMLLKLVDEKIEKLGSALTLLKQYSIINSGQDQAVLNIHRLVQQVTRIKHRDENREEKCLRKAMELFKDNVDFINVDQAISVWNYASDHEGLVKDFIDLPSEIIDQLRAKMRYREAYSFGEKTITILKRQLGFDDDKTLELMKITAAVLFDQGKHNDALRYFQEVKKIQEEKKYRLSQQQAIT